MNKMYKYKTRVYYEDTDAGGVVYYANYLKFAERARTEMLRSIGVDQQVMLETSGMGFVVRHCSVDYLKPAKLDDELLIETRVKSKGGASLDLTQLIYCGGQHLIEMNVKIACINGNGKPVRLPADIADKL